MKRLNVEDGKKNLDSTAGISLSSLLIERWVSHNGLLNQQAVKAAHYQTKTEMKTVQVDS